MVLFKASPKGFQFMIDEMCSVLCLCALCTGNDRGRLLFFSCRSCGALRCFGLLDWAAFFLLSRREKATFLPGLEPSNRIIVGRSAADSKIYEKKKKKKAIQVRKVKCYMEAKLRIRIRRNVFFLCVIMIFFF